MSCIYIEHGATEREIASGERRASERERETVARLDGGSGDRACAPAEPPPSHPALRAPRRGEGEGGRNGEFLGWFSAVEKGWNGMEWSLRLPSVGAGVSRGEGCKGVRRLITQFQDCHYPRPLSTTPPPNSAPPLLSFLPLSLSRSLRPLLCASFRNVNSINATS